MNEGNGGRRVKVGILTVSDRSWRGERSDASGEVIAGMLARLGEVETVYALVPDEQALISGKLVEWADGRAIDLILTTGGTGLAPRDVTPEATRAVVDRLVPGMAEAMRADDVVTLGKLFNESHASLRDDFEVTNDALNWIVQAAHERPECLGARMTGAGFGGCAVALVRRDSAEAFAQAVGAEYRARSGKEAAIFVSEAGEGASVQKM